MEMDKEEEQGKGGGEKETSFLPWFSWWRVFTCEDKAPFRHGPLAARALRPQDSSTHTIHHARERRDVRGEIENEEACDPNGLLTMSRGWTKSASTHPANPPAAKSDMEHPLSRFPRSTPQGLKVKDGFLPCGKHGLDL